jgi:hypothetical protein
VYFDNDQAGYAAFNAQQLMQLVTNTHRINETMATQRPSAMSDRFNFLKINGYFVSTT